METEPSPDNLAIPPDLLAEIQADADKEHRPSLDVLRDVLERGLTSRRSNRRVFRTEDLTEEQIAQIAASRMSPEHDHLDAELLEPAKLTPAEAVAHIFESRKGRHLPEGMTIREMMTHGRD